MPAPKRDASKQRRRHYVDSAVQGRVMVALLAMEIVLLGAAMALVYMNLADAIDQQLYRVHLTRRDVGPALTGALVPVVGWLVLANSVIVIVIDRLWTRHLRRILASLMALLAAIERLDFRSRKAGGIRHEVLDKATGWRNMEHTRHREIRALLDGVDPNADFDDPPVRAGIRTILEQIRALV